MTKPRDVILRSESNAWLGRSPSRLLTNPIILIYGSLYQYYISVGSEMPLNGDL